MPPITFNSANSNTMAKGHTRLESPLDSNDSNMAKKDSPNDQEGGGDMDFLSRGNQEEFQAMMQRVVGMCTNFKLREKVVDKPAEFDEIMQKFNESLPQGPTGKQQWDPFPKKVAQYTQFLLGTLNRHAISVSGKNRGQ